MQSNEHAPFENYQRGENFRASQMLWRDKLHRKLAHKSLDILDDDDEMGDIHVNNTRQGIETNQLLKFALVGAGVFGMWQIPAAITAFKAVKEVVPEVTKALPSVPQIQAPSLPVTPKQKPAPAIDNDTDTATRIRLRGGIPIPLDQIKLPD